MKFIGICYEAWRICRCRPRPRPREHHPQPFYDHLSARRSGRLGRTPFVRTQGDPYPLVPAIVKTVQSIAADQPVERAATLQDVRAEVLTPDKLNAVVFGGFATVALLISSLASPASSPSPSADAPASSASAWPLAPSPATSLPTSSVRASSSPPSVVAGLILGIAGARGLAALIGQVHMPEHSAPSSQRQSFSSPPQSLPQSLPLAPPASMPSEALRAD